MAIRQARASTPTNRRAGRSGRRKPPRRALARSLLKHTPPTHSPKHKNSTKTTRKHNPTHDTQTHQPPHTPQQHQNETQTPPQHQTNNLLWMKLEDLAMRRVSSMPSPPTDRRAYFVSFSLSPARMAISKGSSCEPLHSVFPSRGELRLRLYPMFLLPERVECFYGEMIPTRTPQISHRAIAFPPAVAACFLYVRR